MNQGASIYNVQTFGHYWGNFQQEHGHNNSFCGLGWAQNQAYAHAQYSEKIASFAYVPGLELRIVQSNLVVCNEPQLHSSHLKMT